MAKFHIERGRIIDTTPQVVSCLWKNWDIYDAVLDNKFNSIKEKEGIWTFKVKGFRFKFELIECQHNMKYGTFKYLSTFWKPWASWIPGKSIIILKYSATSDGKTSVMGTIDFEAKGIIALIGKMSEKYAYKLADRIIEGGEISCTMISQNIEKAKEKLTDEQRKILDKYLKEPLTLCETNIPTNILDKKNTLQFVPIGNKSLVRLETSVPKKRRIRQEMEVEEKVDSIISVCTKINRSANFFENISRGIDITHDKGGLIVSGQEFYQEAIKLGQSLYSAYISEDIHAYLTSMIDYSGNVQLNIEAEGRDSTLPWELLHNRMDFLCLKIGLTRIVSEVIKLANKDFDFKGVLIIGSNPKNDLENVEKEAMIVFKALENVEGINKKLLIGCDATKDNVIDEIESGEYQVLHYCGHSEFNKENPRLSFLLFNNERKLLADELARLSEDFGLKLVFLNSCLSGFTGNYGVGVTGLSDSFVKIGVPFVIGMLWPISDQGALILAEEFYDKLLKLKDPVEALRRARLRVGRFFDWKDPVWAAPVIFSQ
ncbi:MAG: CHAT domain-containing protein [Candidatus Aminicenantes bacterium]|nr:CHAT domain-containing protein [Candidatus Aminicenantes bacterium]